MEELASSQSGCRRQKVTAGQTAWRPYVPTGATRLDNDDDDDDDDMHTNIHT